MREPDKTRGEMGEQLFRNRQLVASRSKTFAQNLDAVLSRAREADNKSLRWVEEELRGAQHQLERIEDLESASWSLIARLEGKSAQTRRIEQMEGLADTSIGSDTVDKIIILGYQPTRSQPSTRGSREELSTIDWTCRKGEAPHFHGKTRGILRIPGPIPRTLQRGTVYPDSRDGATPDKTP